MDLRIDARHAGSDECLQDGDVYVVDPRYFGDAYNLPLLIDVGAPQSLKTYARTNHSSGIGTR